MSRGPTRLHAAFLGADCITYEETPAPPELASWVAVTWRITSPVRFDLRVPPDGCMDLIRGDVVGSLSAPGLGHSVTRQRQPDRRGKAAADELRSQGFALFHDARKEPWGQTVARLQSAEGAVIGISFAPWFH